VFRKVLNRLGCSDAHTSTFFAVPFRSANGRSNITYSSYSYLILAHFLCAWDAFTTRERPSGAGKQPPLLSAVSAVTITDNSKSFVFKTILVPFDIQVEFLLNPLWLKSVIPSLAGLSVKGKIIETAALLFIFIKKI
jgi:hypothetical protein